MITREKILSVLSHWVFALNERDEYRVQSAYIFCALESNRLPIGAWRDVNLPTCLFWWTFERTWTRNILPPASSACGFWPSIISTKPWLGLENGGIVWVSSRLGEISHGWIRYRSRLDPGWRIKSRIKDSWFICIILCFWEQRPCPNLVPWNKNEW